MHFVQSAFLLASVAVAIPVIVHLMFRSQARRVNLGTLRFLKQVLERNAQRQRIMRWLLLALRVAAVLLLAFLFARPYFVEAAPGGDRRLLMILIDRSASMDLKGDQGRLLEQAVAEARRAIADQPERTRVEVAFFDDAIRPLVGEETEGAAGKPGTRDSTARLLDDWHDTATSFHATNYGAAINWARDLAVRESAAEEELHIYTDLQQSGLDWAEVDPLPENVKVHLHDLGRAVVRNLGVTEARPLRGVVRPGEGTTIQSTILNSTPFPVADQQVVLKLESPRGKLSLRERVKLEPGSTGSAKFEIPPLEEGLWTGTVSIDADDDLEFDNIRQVAILASPANRVLLADGDPTRSPLLGETWFLATSLRLAPSGEAYSETPFDPVVVSLEPGDSLPPLEGVKVVVLANVGEVTAEDARALARFVSDGGGLIVFGGNRVQAKGYASLAAVGLVPGRIAGPVHASDLPFRLDSWEEQHPILRPFADPQHGDLRRLTFRGYTKLIVDPPADPSTVDKTSATPIAPPAPSKLAASGSAKVLARFRNGDPVIVEQTLGSGKAVWFTSTCDRGWGEWPSSKLYLPLVHQIVGDPLGLNEGGPVRSTLIDAATPAAAKPAVVARAGYSQVINPSPRESETERCTRQEFAERFQLTLAVGSGEPVIRPTAAASLAGTDLRKDERWHWAAVALVALMLLESFVGNRTVS